MRRRPRFKLVFAEEALGHMNAIERKLHPWIRDATDDQLVQAPDRPTRNRKPLDAPADFGATWELRCGSGNRFRVFYEIDSTGMTVQILAVGVKEGNSLRIGGEEVQL
ncbi:MAG: addiction module toxin RelE [Chloroflexi bacterium]|nr:addiction module toxin RelE [Chloroflexota bacterium]